MSKCFILLVLLLFTACESDIMEAESLGSNAGIIGTWVEDEYRGDTLLLYRAGELDKLSYSFTLEDDGTFIERKNAGWCATPPIAYNNYEGKWSKLTDSLINVESEYWGGIMFFQLEIILHLFHLC